MRCGARRDNSGRSGDAAADSIHLLGSGRARASRTAAAYGYFAALGFELPADSNWLLAVAVLADACVTLGDADGAAELVRLLEPWPTVRSS